MTIDIPPPRYAVLLGHHTTVGDEKSDLVMKWHYNHRLYEHAGSARSYAKQAHGHGGNDKSLVIKIDPALCEPDGMSAQEEYEYWERMTDYCANRAVAAKQVAESVEFAQPRPKRTRGKGTAKRPKRRKKKQNLPFASLAKQILPLAGAVILGNMISKFGSMQTRSNETPITTPPADFLTNPLGLPAPPKGPDK